MGERLKLRLSTLRPRIAPGAEYAQDPNTPEERTVVRPEYNEPASRVREGGPKATDTTTPPTVPGVDLYSWRQAMFKAYDARSGLYRARIDGVGVRWIDLTMWEYEVVDGVSLCCKCVPSYVHRWQQLTEWRVQNEPVLTAAVYLLRRTCVLTWRRAATFKFRAQISVRLWSSAARSKTTWRTIAATARSAH